jgi:hypothetical protein
MQRLQLNVNEEARDWLLPLQIWIQYNSALSIQLRRLRQDIQTFNGGSLGGLTRWKAILHPREPQKVFR